MGNEPEVFLVRRSILCKLVLVIGLAPFSAQGEIVRRENYHDFWLWAGVSNDQAMNDAQVVYLLQGEVGPDHSGGVRIKAQGGSQPGAHGPALWLVYRVQSLDWPPSILSSMQRRVESWRNHSGTIKGIQIDFDASTRGLQNYVEFLRHLRSSLQNDLKLSVTGLMDWASQARPDDLNKLSGSVDEIIFQTYRGNRTVADIDAYLARLSRLRIPFKLGLVERGEWNPPESIAQNPYFRGYVVFLRNSSRDPIK